MNEFTLTRLKILVERAVRPIRACTSRKRKMREELLSHVISVFEEEVARLANEQSALERTAQRFGDSAELTGQLQKSVPTLDSIERFADWVFFRLGESAYRRAVRYTMISEVVAMLLVIFAPLRLGELICCDWYTNGLVHTYSILLSIGCTAFTICILELSMRRSLGEQTRLSWLQFALVLVGSTIVSMTLGLWAFGISPKNILWVAFFTVGSPVGLASGLAPGFAARKRYEEEWASLQIE